MAILKLIVQFLRWLMTLSGLKMTIVILILVIGGESYWLVEKNNTIENLGLKLDTCRINSNRDERWWAIRTDSIVSAKTQKYEELLLKLIDKAELVEQELRETNKINQKTIENLNKK